MREIEERARLAGSNKMEVLAFSLGRNRRTGHSETYGINVFKVREVLKAPEITRLPSTPPAVAGIVSLRGTVMPVIDLARYCGVESDDAPAMLIVTEFARSVQGFLVHAVENIHRLDWERIEPPPAAQGASQGLITALARLDDARILLILDVEKVLADLHGLDRDVAPEDLEETKAKVSATVFYADDSAVARKRIESVLDALGAKRLGANNGREAWERLQEIAARAEAEGVPVRARIQAVLTDIEMPEMDGYVLTKKIKADPRFAGVPVVMYSSLSSAANADAGKRAGADAYVPKFDSHELAQTLRAVVRGGGEA